MALDMLMNQVKNAIMNHSDQQGHTGFDPSALLGQVEGLFGQHQANNPDQGNNQNGNNVQPASDDSYGDPADQSGGRFANVRPASEDPDGDPADNDR